MKCVILTEEGSREKKRETGVRIKETSEGEERKRDEKREEKRRRRGREAVAGGAEEETSTMHELLDMARLNQCVGPVTLVGPGETGSVEEEE